MWQKEKHFMKFKREKTYKDSKNPISSILMYAGAILVALIGIASLVNNVILFNSSVTSYIGQGYTRAAVYKQLVPGQLLPSIFEAVALYGGIAFALLCAGMINNKLSKTLILLANTKNEVNTENEEISIIEIEQANENDEIGELIEA
jgi:hypothetical protein